MKKRDLLMGVALWLTLAGCSTAKLPPFASSRWSLNGNVVSSVRHDMAINFGGSNPFPITNMSNGEYDLNFITTAEQFQTYAPDCKEYIESVIRRLPLKIDSLQFVLADRYVVFTPAVNNQWLPDLVRQADGAELVTQANPVDGVAQPHDEIWRNCVFDTKRHRILVVDRLVKNGKHLGIVYVMQGDDKRVPFSGTFHYDITDRRHTQPVGEHMRALFDITIAADTSHVSSSRAADR